jgi:autotransporter translocation and assembly factor TamB
LTRALLGTILTLLLVILTALLLIQTSWAHEQLRALIVRTANRTLAGTLEIGSLGGSFVRGIQVDRVRLSRDGRTIVAVDHAEVSYSIRDLLSTGTFIRRVSLVRPRVVASKLPDGRWDVASLVRTRTSTGSPSTRALRIDRIDIQQADVRLNDALAFGAVHLPAVFAHLVLEGSFSMGGGSWTFDIARAAFDGAQPTLVVTSLTGALSNSDAGWSFDALKVETPRTSFTLDGRIEHGQEPTVLDLHVDARRFAFQEWGGVLHGLANIAVESSFQARLNGPLGALHTVVGLRSTGGGVDADVVLDTTVDGWHASGSANVNRFDLARWLNRQDRPSDVTGSAVIDLDLHLGGHFPAGAFRFGGPHAAYLEYEAENVLASGTITATAVRIVSFTGRAYGSNVHLRPGSTVAIDAPYGFHFVGALERLDLRQVPRNVPVPRVESTLALDFDVDGQFDHPFIRGGATFAPSTFLGTEIGAGSTGHIDTSVAPVAYGGEGDLAAVDLHHLGEALEIEWLQDPRWAGTLRGHFRVNGAGSGDSIILSGGGRLERAALFDGLLENADVSVEVRDGSLEGTYDGALVRIDPSIPMADERFSGRLTGRARGKMRVVDILRRSPSLNDYSLEATLDASQSVVRGFDVEQAAVRVALEHSTLRIDSLTAASRGTDLVASGSLELDDMRSSRIEYRVDHADLARWSSVLGSSMTGTVAARGVLTGPLDRLRFAGDADVALIDASGARIPAGQVAYDVTVPPGAPGASSGSLALTAATVTVGGRPVRDLHAQVTYDAGQATLSLRATVSDSVTATLTSTLHVDTTAKQAEVTALTVGVRQTAWRLVRDSRPHVTWTGSDVTVDRLDLVDTATEHQLLAVSGTAGADYRLQFETRDLSMDALLPGNTATTVYGGTLNATGTLTGPRDRPALRATFAITSGRIRRLAYERFSGRVDYADELFDIDVRLDQSAGVFITAAGTVPLSLFDRSLPARPLHVAVKSTPISLTLLEGVTDVIRNVNGQMELDFTAIGTTGDPHFDGRIAVTGAAFEVVSSGARYHNVRLALSLASDRISVETLHVEDDDRHPLDVTGSLGTHELRVGDLQVSVTARGFQILRNEFGRMSVDAQIGVTGQFESPRVTGRIAVSAGSIQVDRLLDRTLFQPYSTEAAVAPAALDPIVALNPWDRMGLNVQFATAGTLRMAGDNVQVSQGTPIGLGNINLRVFGELNFYKDPAGPLYVTGSLDSLTGTYAFQGRRFDVDPSSSIEFRGDLNPELYITVDRLISGVETHVSIVGPLQQPELHLTSEPPLDASNILSLIVFNTSTNDLTALQQQQLAVRAGTLAAGFIAAPMVSALERTLGLDTLEIDPGTGVSGGTKVTVGDEIAPGLVARFSRQFGPSEYDEAQLEYYLSRLFRLRATFSDAASLIAQSPFRRIERAGVDLLLFFSF